MSCKQDMCNKYENISTLDARQLLENATSW